MPHFLFLPFFHTESKSALFSNILKSNIKNPLSLELILVEFFFIYYDSQISKSYDYFDLQLLPRLPEDCRIFVIEFCYVQNENGDKSFRTGPKPEFEHENSQKNIQIGSGQTLFFFFSFIIVIESATNQPLQSIPRRRFLLILLRRGRGRWHILLLPPR